MLVKTLSVKCQNENQKMAQLRWVRFKEEKEVMEKHHHRAAEN